MHYFIILLFLISCDYKENKITETKKDNFTKLKVLTYKGRKKLTCVTLSFDNICSNYYHQRLVNIPHLTDDPSSRYFSLPDFIIAASLNFEDVELPEKIKQVLIANKLFSKEKLDIFWLVQNSANLGEAEDYSSIPTTTRLKAHAWADPNASSNYSGTRVNKEFLLGIFDADYDISTKNFLYETMTPSFIHTHDSVFSPRDERNMLKISSESSSLSFFSLVIDNNEKAAVTFHWVLKWSDQEEADLRTFIKNYKEPIILKQFINDLSKVSFKNINMLAKLQKFIKF